MEFCNITLRNFIEYYTVRQSSEMVEMAEHITAIVNLLLYAVDVYLIIIATNCCRMSVLETMMLFSYVTWVDDSTWAALEG